MNKSVFKKLGKSLEFLSVGAGLVLGVVFLDPMSVNTTQTTLSNVSTPQAFEFDGTINEFPVMDGVLFEKQHTNESNDQNI